jgi:prevent-host-death family protein
MVPKLMDTMPISKFKATCLAALERVRATGRPLRVTRFGKPVADIVPAKSSIAQRSFLGAMRGTAEVVGNILEPSSKLAPWKALE